MNQTFPSPEVTPFALGTFSRLSTTGSTAPAFPGLVVGDAVADQSRLAGPAGAAITLELLER